MRAGEAFWATVENDPDFQRWWHSDERRRKWEAFTVEIKRCVADGHKTWNHFIGEPMPTGLEEIRLAARRFGLSPDAVLRGDFTLADVTTLMMGKRLAAADDLLDRTRAAAAEAAVRAAGSSSTNAPPPGSTQAEAVDDEYAAIARRLDGKARRVLWFMRENETDKFVDGLRRRDIADQLRMTIDAVAEALEVIRNCGKAHGKTLYRGKRGPNGKVWLEPDGFRVAEHCTPAGVIAATLKKRA